jgi:hypothetical protein
MAKYKNKKLVRMLMNFFFFYFSVVGETLTYAGQTSTSHLEDEI